jgi:Protein of unknown function (DUF3021).
MKKIIRYCSWELKNDFASSTYFAIIILMYCITRFILGIKEVDIFVIFEMYITIYVLSTLQKLILDDEKEYDEKTFIGRAAFISIFSVIVIVAVSILGKWFEGMPLWTAITIYTMLIISYLTVWIILKLEKKYDTKKLNQQLANFKKQ